MTADIALAGVGSTAAVATDDQLVILEAAVASPVPGLGSGDDDGMPTAAASTSSTELYRNLFEKLDLKRDGRVDAEELVVGLHNMGYLHLSQDQIEMFLKNSDASHSGDLTLAEFVEYLQKHEKQLRFMFSTLDMNRDGRICRKEIKAAFQRMGIFISEDEAEKLVARIDDDGSLDISFEEWRDYLMFHPSSDMGDIIEYWRDDAYVGSLPTEALIERGWSDRLLAGIWWRHLVAGGVAGAISRTCTAPLDRLKVMLQVHGGRKKLGIVECMRYMIREGGLKGLWRGNGINVIKIAPESALKFGAYDEMKRLIKGNENRDLFIHERFLAGSFAGAFSQTVIYPLEVMKTRLALRKTGEFTGIRDCANKIYSVDGFKVFYRGYWPNLLGIIPYAGIDLAVYETLKRKFLEQNPREDQNPNALLLLSCGTFSSCCGQLAAYPLALIRTKLQSQAGAQLELPREQTHSWGLFWYTVRTEGVKGLYRGLVPNFCKVAPAVSISYYVYERTRSRLGVEMS